LYSFTEIIGIKGHSTDGDNHGECFDYFVPATKRGEELAETFIIDGVGHDMYPRSWERRLPMRWRFLGIGEADVYLSRHLLKD